jgi:hypothetical protein
MKHSRKHGAMILEDSYAEADSVARREASQAANMRATALVERLFNGFHQPTIDRTVYFISNASGTAIKIGVTTDLPKRLLSLRIANPEELSVVATLPAMWCTEQIVHRYFSTSRIRGEWFRPTEDILEFIRLLNADRDVY